jgi:hypothetical protein
LAEVQRVRVLSKEAPVISPRHSLLLAVHHALRNDFVADEMVRDLLDFSAWMEILGPKGEGASLLQAAKGWGLQVPALAMEQIVTRIRATPATWLAPHASAGDQRKAASLAELYFHQVEAGALNTDLVYLTDPKPLLQIMTGVVSGWSRYRAMMKGMDTANGNADATLGARLRSLMRAATHLPARRWRQVRALASAKQEVFK